jgi:hypothetical protein
MKLFHEDPLRFAKDRGTRDIYAPFFRLKKEENAN